jgi:phenylacetate-coenzyme A ligase PaaK-like adenylate-forming protein
MTTFFSVPKAYLNFALALRGFAKNTVTETEVRNTIRKQIENREDNFIRMLKTNVFDYSRSPYLDLFKAAKLGHSDVERMVAQQGLETTLEELYDANVYVTFEEFKGRVPLKRGTVERQLDASDFDNINLNPILVEQSSGSTGKPTRTKMDLDHIAQIAKHVALEYNVNGDYSSTVMRWAGLLPSEAQSALHHAHMGKVVERWFSSNRRNEANIGWGNTILTYLLVVFGRLNGMKFPFPEYVPIDAPLPIAEALAEGVQRSGAVVIWSTVSKCVRISVAANSHGIDLSGVTFIGVGEPSTPAKVAVIQLSGARHIAHYGSTETGTIGLACGNSVDENDVHLMSNNLALIQRPTQVFDQIVDAFHFTTLLPTNPKMLINVQLDDFGIVEERDCGCPLYQMGMTRHIRKASSYRKLTGEGVTLVGSDMVHILEHVLPAQFGGSLLDYQLVEEENEQGFTKLVLVVDPSVPIQDENALKDTFLDAMRNSMPSVRVAQVDYRKGDVVTIRRAKPFVTSRGKYFPIRTLNMM